MIHDLKPYPAYKDSGVPWLGKVPEHWIELRIKNLFREKDERSGDGNGVLLSLTRARGIIPQTEASNRIASAEDLSKYKVCRPSDLIMNRMQAWSGMFAVSSYNGLVSPDYSVFAAIGKLDVKYFEHLFKTPILVEQFAQRSKGIGSGFNRLYTPDFGAVSLVIPPLFEQSAIVRYLDHFDQRIRHYIRAKKKLIKLLEEQKQAIIQQAVTCGLDPNVKLKSSGVEWLGDVPKHWEVLRLKSLVTEAVAGPYGSSLTKAMYTQQGYRVYGQQQVIPDDFTIGDYYISAEQFSQMQRYRVFTGDVLVSVMGTVGRVAVVPKNAEPGIINPRLVRYRPDITRVKPRYLQLAMQGPTSQVQLREAAKGTTMEGLNMQILGKLVLAIPPLSEQDAILNEWHTKSEVLVYAENSIRSEISLLREYRTRLIADVVTGKLDVREAAASLPDKSDEMEIEDDFEEETIEESLEEVVTEEMVEGEARVSN